MTQTWSPGTASRQTQPWDVEGSGLFAGAALDVADQIDDHNLEAELHNDLGETLMAMGALGKAHAEYVVGCGSRRKSTTPTNALAR